MSAKVRYRLYDLDGRFLFLGSAPECADFIGIDLATFRRYAAMEDYLASRICQIERATSKSDAEAAANWDNFIRRFRRGIGVDSE